MIKSEKGISESLECIKKYQKELDEYIHSEKIKDDLGRLLGGFVPLESLIASAKFADISTRINFNNNDQYLEDNIIEIADTVNHIIPIYEKVGDENFVLELKKKGLYRNLERLFQSELFKYNRKFSDLYIDPRLNMFNGYIAYNIKSKELCLFWNFYMNDPSFFKNEDCIFIYEFEEINFEKNRFFRNDDFGELTRLLFFSIFSEEYFKKTIDLLLSDFILNGYNKFVSNFLLMDISSRGDILEENKTLLGVPNCFIDDNLKNEKMLYFLEKFRHFWGDEYKEFVKSDFVRNLPLEKVQNLKSWVFTTCYSHNGFDGCDWLKDELIRRLSIPTDDARFNDQKITLSDLNCLSELYDEQKIETNISLSVRNFFRNTKNISFDFGEDIKSEKIPDRDEDLLKLSINNYIDSLKDKKTAYVIDCIDRLHNTRSPFIIDKNDVFSVLTPILSKSEKFYIRQAYYDMYKLNILKNVGYTPNNIFLFVSEYKWGANLEDVDATFYNIKNLMNNHKELNIKVFVLEDIVRSFDPKDNTLDLELFQNETGLKEFQLVKSKEDMFDILEKDGFEEIIFE